MEGGPGPTKGKNKNEGCGVMERGQNGRIVQSESGEFIGHGCRLASAAL